MLNTICCVTSCYFYAAMATFENLQNDLWTFHLMIGFEAVFAFDIIFNFFAQYTETGH